MCHHGRCIFLCFPIFFLCFPLLKREGVEKNIRSAQREGGREKTYYAIKTIRCYESHSQRWSKNFEAWGIRKSQDGYPQKWSIKFSSSQGCVMLNWRDLSKIQNGMIYREVISIFPPKQVRREKGRWGRKWVTMTPLLISFSYSSPRVPQRGW